MKLARVFGWAMVALLVGCAPFAVPSSWPVSLKRNVAVASPMLGALRPVVSWNSLSQPEQTLLTFLADADRVKEAVGVQRAYGPNDWRVVEIYRLEPSKRWSVLCEEGHDQEALYFEYQDADAVWYRVEHFDSEHPVRHAAVKLKGAGVSKLR